jgi:hypothetical protein
MIGAVTDVLSEWRAPSIKGRTGRETEPRSGISAVAAAAAAAAAAEQEHDDGADGHARP